MAEIVGFQRVADPGACEFCQEVDGAYLKADDVMPLHNNCGCSVEPITAEELRAKRATARTRRQPTVQETEALQYYEEGGLAESDALRASGGALDALDGDGQTRIRNITNVIDELGTSAPELYRTVDLNSLPEGIRALLRREGGTFREWGIGAASGSKDFPSAWAEGMGYLFDPQKTPVVFRIKRGAKAYHLEDYIRAGGVDAIRPFEVDEWLMRPGAKFRVVKALHEATYPGEHTGSGGRTTKMLEVVVEYLGGGI